MTAIRTVGVMNVFDLGTWAFGALGGLVALDTILPLVPSEAAVIVAAASAGSPAAVAGVVAATAAGAVAGDVVMHLAGRRLGRTGLGRRVLGRLGTAPADRLGTPAVVLGRFVPGGRSAVAVGTGLTEMPGRRFLVASAAGSMLWATFMVVLGRLGARITTNSIAQVAIGLGLALAFGLVVSLIRRVVRRSRRRAAGDLALLADKPPVAVPVVVRRRQSEAGRVLATNLKMSSAVWPCQPRMVGRPGGAAV